MRRGCVKSVMVSGGSACGARNRPGTDAAMPCPAPGKRFGDREQLRGQGNSWVGLACSGGDARGSLETWGFHLCSVSFCHSHQALAGRHRALHPFAGSSDHADRGFSKEAASIRMDQGAVLLALQSQGKVKVSLGKWKIKAASANPVLWSPSRREHPEQAEQAALFLPSAAACGTAHSSAHLGHSRLRLTSSPPGEAPPEK